jgi:hypothetical protein
MGREILISVGAQTLGLPAPDRSLQAALSAFQEHIRPMTPVLYSVFTAILELQTTAEKHTPSLARPQLLARCWEFLGLGSF